MKTWLLIFYLLSLCNIGLSQAAYTNTETGIKTRKGYLIVSDVANNTYTLSLEGNIQFSKTKEGNNYYGSPIINGYSLFRYAEGVHKYGNYHSKDSLLLSYKNITVEAIHRNIGSNISDVHEQFFINADNNQTMHFWDIDYSKGSNINKLQPARLFVLSFTQNNYIYSFSTIRKSSELAEAKEMLMEVYKKMRFYTKPINFRKLKNGIWEGCYCYVE